jgi:hypothetical protein
MPGPYEPITGRFSVLARCHGTQGNRESRWRFDTLGWPLEHQGAQAGHGDRPMTLVADWDLSRGEVLQTEKRQLEAVLDTNLLKQP